MYLADNQLAHILIIGLFFALLFVGFGIIAKINNIQPASKFDLATFYFNVGLFYGMGVAAFIQVAMTIFQNLGVVK